MGFSRRAVLTWHDDGNGGRVLSVNLTTTKLILTLVISAIAIYAGISEGVEQIGTAHIRSWWTREGQPSTSILIAEGIERHRQQSEVELQRQLAGIEKELTKLQALAQRNHETSNKLLDVVINKK